MKKKVLFFARSFLVKFVSEIRSDIFESYLVVLTKSEKSYLLGKDITVYGCFEEEYDDLEISSYEGSYLKTSFYSDRFLNRFCLDKRREILGKEITFWRKVLSNVQPDCIVNETVAIEMCEVLALEANLNNIKYISDLHGFFPYTFYFKPDPFNGRLEDLSGVQPTEEHMKIAYDYYTSVLEKNYKPYYVLDSLSPLKVSFKSVIHSVYRDLLLTYKKHTYQKLKYFQYEDDYSSRSFQTTSRLLKRLVYKYDSLSSLDSKSIVFFPLHFEPEAILNYFAEEYQNQVFTIESIARSIKIDQYLVVKEHPQQKGVLLDKRFRDLKNKMPNLIILPAEINSFDVIKKSDAIVTLTSTAAWEAVILGKPVFVLGKIFFDQCPGVTRIDNIVHFKNEIRKKSYSIPDKEAVLSFTAKMISKFQKGSPSFYAKEDFCQNVIDYTSAIERFILNT